MATHSSILAGKSHQQRSQAGYSPGGCKELDKTECVRTHTHTHTHTHWNDGWEMGHRRSDAQGSHHKFSSIRRWSDFLPHTHPQREMQCFTIVQWSVACRLRCKKHVNECTNISMYTYIGICTYTHMYAGIQNRGLNKSCEYSWDIDGKVD